LDKLGISIEHGKVKCGTAIGLKHVGISPFRKKGFDPWMIFRAHRLQK
jgi:hypothetical protein